ncbi:hypothetical protein MUS1_06430 [Marinomonas ushuaiensis DSM 15871]|uniref:Uncharacterized protein n=1 Tax=Marinomonas ushuaiensis DSM 15871 TaxID=1122207 RepID=X7E393_9GAMM|nr:hypothetical protein [Marinomonas ushuaiensis]ETX09648.1 hypothetical protein MUS1_06430 [Marinomonas ushuaiensis DSM 15871]
MDDYITLTESTTQISIGMIYVMLAFFIGYLEANTKELENYLSPEFLQTENSTVHTGFLGDYS